MLKGVNTQGGMIIAEGVATVYAQEGLPLAEMEKEVKSKGLRISWLNVADQFQKMGFTRNRIVSEMQELNHFHPNACDVSQIEDFLEMSYTDQRDLLGEYWKKQGAFPVLIDDIAIGVLDSVNKVRQIFQSEGVFVR